MLKPAFVVIALVVVLATIAPAQITWTRFSENPAFNG
jgi:DNA-binding transcriptional regulator of glucitol operon